MKNIEILKSILLSDDVKTSIKNNEDIIFNIIPMLKYEKNFDQKSEWHSYDVWNHTIEAISSSPKDFEIRLILLLHDIGKPFSYQDDHDIRHFKGHAIKSKEISKPILEKLGYKDKKLNELLFLIGEHATKIDINFVNLENINLYNKLLTIQFCDANAYEITHSKQIISNLQKIKNSMFKNNDNISKIILGTGSYYNVESGNTVSVTGDGGNSFGYYGPSYKKLAPKLITYTPYIEQYNKLKNENFSNEQYTSFRKKIEDEYIKSYYDIRLKDLDTLELLLTLKEKFGNNIILLCHEPIEEFCHRRLIADYIELKTGIYIPEVSVSEKGVVKKLQPIRYKKRLKKIIDSKK